MSNPKIDALPSPLVHELLVQVRDRVATRWGRSWRGPCVIAHLAAVLEIHEDLGSVAFSSEGRAFIQALGFTSANSVYRWNDSAPDGSVILARLDQAIRETAPAPADPFPEVKINDEKPEPALV